MSSFSTQWPGDFESLARQYWNAWGDNLRQQAGGGLGANTTPDWQQAVQWWSRLVPGQHSGIADLLGRFNGQPNDWYGRMQQVAAQFTGSQGSVAEISQAWQKALGANDANPAAGMLHEMVRTLRGGGQHAGLDEWITQAMPFVESLRRERAKWLHAPTFGLNREHQERWQHLAQAQDDYQQCSDAFNQLMAKATQRAFALFEVKLAEHESPDKQLTSVRALFDLWIDAAEDAYAEYALSPEFAEVYGELTNAQMRLRASIQGEVEQFCGLLGMPSRTEVDAAHRKIAELQRALRKLSARDAKTLRPETPRARTVVAAVADLAPAVAPVAASPAAVDEKPRTAGTTNDPKRKAPVHGKRVPAKSSSKPAPKTAPVKKTSTTSRTQVRPKSAEPGQPDKRKTNTAVPAKKTSSSPASRKSVAAKMKRKVKTAKQATVSKAAAVAGKRRGAAPTAPRKRATASHKSAAAPAAGTPINVVSMKDWVSRNIAERDDDPKKGTQRKLRNGKQGARK